MSSFYALGEQTIGSTGLRLIQNGGGNATRSGRSLNRISGEYRRTDATEIAILFR